MDYPAQNTGEGGAALVPVIPLEKLTLELPFCGAVPAGFPSPADDYLEERLSLDKYIIKNPSSTFFLKVEGLSMKDAGIYPDDILVVDRSLEPQPGDVIIAVLEGEFTVKRFVREGGQYFLKPENKEYRPVLLHADLDFLAWGVVTHVIHKPYEL